jgi:hypothetical protein
MRIKYIFYLIFYSFIFLHICIKIGSQIMISFYIKTVLLIKNTLIKIKINKEIKRNIE